MKKQYEMIKKAFFAGLFLCIGANVFGQHLPTDSTETVEELPENEIRLFAPNAFTPDGDYYNDTWGVFIEGNDIYDFHLTIFNRSGEIVWESYNSGATWDGTFGNNPVPEGIYPWVIETGDLETDKRHQFSGFINVLR